MKVSSPHGSESTGKQMYLVDLRQIVSNADSLSTVLNNTCGLWETIYDQMTANETLWVVAPNDYRDGQMWPVAMAVADYAREESKLTLKNTITVHHWKESAADMLSAYNEILFFVRNKREYQFHKDRIRVAHVYEGHEWGGEREEGNSAYHDQKVRRYNPDGKDPGNVWIEEDRTQTDNQEVDETRPIPLSEAIRRCVLVGSEEGESVYLIDVKDDIKNIVPEEGRNGQVIDIQNLKKATE